MTDTIERLQAQVLRERTSGDVEEAAIEEIKRLRGEVADLKAAIDAHDATAQLTGALRIDATQLHLGHLENLKGFLRQAYAERDAAVKAHEVVLTERDAAVGLLRELVESRHKHYIHQTDEIMPRWDERVAAAIDAAKGET